MTNLSPAAVFAIAALVAACTEVRWSKPGVAAATLDEDLVQCTQSARLEARREQLPRLAAPPTVVPDPQGRPMLVQSPPRDGERFLVEHDLTRQCMRNKGYDLVPADRAPARDR